MGKKCRRLFAYHTHTYCSAECLHLISQPFWLKLIQKFKWKALLNQLLFHQGPNQRQGPNAENRKMLCRDDFSFFHTKLILHMCAFMGRSLWTVHFFCQTLLYHMIWKTRGCSGDRAYVLLGQFLTKLNLTIHSLVSIRCSLGKSQSRRLLPSPMDLNRFESSCAVRELWGR